MSLFNDGVDAVGGLFVTFALHATLLLAAIWLLERLRALRDPSWREWAWRMALFGAFMSLALQLAPWSSPGAHTSANADANALNTPARHGTTPGDSTAVAGPAEMGLPVEARDPATAHAPDSTTASVARVPLSPVNAPGDTGLSLSPPWQGVMAVLALWVCGTLLGLALTLRQAAGLLRLRRRLLASAVPAGEELLAETAALAAGLGLRMPTLRIVDGLATPLALPGMVVLPQWALALDATRQRAMLAHELAHLSRHDPLWRALQRLALAPLWWHPLAWRAVRRLETLAETRCDAAAVSLAGTCADARAGRARALAECLAECLSRHVNGARTGAVPLVRGSGWALAMAEHGDGIVGRVRDLLETSNMHTSPPKRRWRWVAAAAAVLTLLALPAVTLIVRSDHALSVVIDDGGSRRAIHSDMAGGERFRVRMDGDVRFTADEHDVASLGDDARLLIEHREGGTRRQIDIVSEEGRIVRRYSIGGQDRPFDAEASTWLARQIPEIYRMTGHQAPERAQRILAGGGADALLTEIEAIRNDSVRALYVEQLLALTGVDDAQAARVFTLIDNNNSDFERRRMLTAALPRFAAVPDRHPSMLMSAQRMDSDFERAEWLMGAADQLPVEGAALGEWALALAAFDSDFERRRVLEALAKKGRPQLQAAAVALIAAEAIDNDFERRSALQTLAGERVPLDAARYIAIASGIDSDFDLREALTALIARGVPDVETSRAILRSVRGMHSDFERTQVLAALATRMPRDPGLIDDYRAVTRGMADHERGEAEKALDRFYPEG